MTENKEPMEENFLEIHAKALYEFKKYMGELCLEIRTRNKLSREYVEFKCGVTERSITKIELHYNTSIDLINTVYCYYKRHGYITDEIRDNNKIGGLFK